MTGIVCALVGNAVVTAVAQVIRYKKGITAVGNAQVDTAQSKFGGSSALFDGTGDYLLVENIAGDITGDFSFECWVRFSAFPSSGSFHMLATGDGNRYFALKNDGGTQKWESSVMTGVNQYVARYTPTISTGVWYHIALVKSGSTLTLYQDGTALTATTLAGSMTSTSTLFTSSTNILGAYTSANYSLNGWMDELRISNTARYTTGFTPSTTAFVNDDNTVLLIHANGTDATTFFEDDNGVRASRSLVAQGNAQVDTAQSKFGGSALLCDGTGDYVMSPAGTQWDFGTSSFTIEFFIRFNVAPTLYVPIALRPTSGISNGEWWCEITNAEKKMYWGFKNQAGTQYYVNLALAGTAFTTGVWYHIALVNNAGTAQLYIDGVATGTTTALSGSFGISTSDLWVGAGAGSYSLNGWLDEVRISNTARYTTGFTPTSTRFVNDSNTLLLMHMDATDAATVFRDDNGSRRQAGITATSTVVTSTTQSKFGGSSVYFPETSGQELLAYYDPQTMGLTNNGDFTVELWAYFTKLPSSGDTGYMMFYSHNPEPYVLFQNGGVYLGAGGYPGFTGSTFAINTWYHVAVSRASGSMKCFVNGTQYGSTVTGSTYNYITYTDNLATRFGKFTDDRGRWQGYMDEIRFSKVARYTANFTAPTAPFQNDADTLLLIHGDGTNSSTVFFDDNGKTTTP